MGSNISIEKHNLMQKIDNELNVSSQAISNANCQIKSGNVDFEHSNNCNIVNINKCIAKTSAGLNSIIEAATNAYMESNNKQKTKLLPGLNVNSSREDVKNILKTKINENCGSESNATSYIKNGDITLRYCKDSTIKNFNYASAQSQCAVQTLLDTIDDTHLKFSNEQETSSLFGGVFGSFGSTFVWIILIICILYILSSSISCMFFSYEIFSKKNN